MKKYLLVNVAILFAVAFCLTAKEAAIAEPKIDIEADAKVTWGIDLGSGNGKTAEDRGVKHGFKNQASWKVKFPLIKKGDKTSAKNEVPVYAEVTLKDIELNIQSKHDKKDFAFDGKVDKLEAKLVFYGAYLQVYNKPDFKTNYANLWDPLKKSDNYDDVKAAVTRKFEPGFDGFGTKIGYANKNFMDLDVGLKFGSNGNWEAKDKDPEFLQNTQYFDGERKVEEGWTALKISSPFPWAQNEYTGGEKPAPGIYYLYKGEGKKVANHSRYGIGFDFAMKPLDKMLGIKFMLNTTFNAARTHTNKDGKNIRGYNWGVSTNQVADQVALSFGTEVTSEPMDGLKFKLGFDGGSKFYTGNIKGSERVKAFAWDMLFDTTYKWISGGVYVASAGTPYAGYNRQTKDLAKQRNADMAVYLKFETKGKKKDDGSLEDSYIMEGLEAGAYVGMYNLLSKKNNDPAKDGNKVLGIRDYESKETIDMLLKLWASYKLNLNDAMSIKPFATFWGETNHLQVGSGEKPVTKPYFAIAYDLGVTYSPAEKVEVEAKWAHGKVGKNQYWTLIEKPANYRTHNGTFTLSVKVKY